MSGRRTARWVPLLVVALGGLFFLAGAYLLYDNLSFLGRAQRTLGEVVKVDKNYSTSRSSGSSTTSVSYTPTFRFLTWDGEHEAATMMSSSAYDYDIGEEVEILYDPDDPDDVRIQGIFSLYIFPLIFLLAGAAVIWIGLFARRKMSGPD